MILPVPEVKVLNLGPFCVQYLKILLVFIKREQACDPTLGPRLILCADVRPSLSSQMLRAAAGCLFWLLVPYFQYSSFFLYEENQYENFSGSICAVSSSRTQLGARDRARK